jgi:uncharacterized peroxidase-related enzyme
MTRISTATYETATDATKSFMDGIKAKFGKVPNFFGTIAQAPAAATAFASFNGALAETSLTAPEREAIALAQAGYHGCPYCAAAHTAIAKGAGVTEAETQIHLTGVASDPKTQSLITFTLTVVGKRGKVANEDIAAVKAAGFSEGQIIEAIAVVTANMFTNFVNLVATTDVDFPKVSIPTKQAA